MSSSLLYRYYATAKGILAEIVRGMFLNSTEHLGLLGQMKAHALDVYEAVQRGNFDEMGRLVGKSWELNKRLDAGTNPPSVEAIIRMVHDYCLGYKLPGAGGGGYCIWWQRVLKRRRISVTS